MSEEGFFAILFLAGIAYAVYFVYSLMKGWEQGRAEGRQVAQAKAIERGEKPVGKPFGQTYGSAYLMHPRQIRESGLGFSFEEFMAKRQRLEMGFLYFGEVHYQTRSSRERNDYAIVALEGPGHVMTIAPTRSGKGTCAVIPNLLNCQSSTVVNDIKGENYAVTHIWRESSEHDVYKFAPFEEDSASWNPFDAFGEDEDAWDDARHMAELLITDSPGKDAFWNNGARNILTGLILHIAESAPPEQRNLSHLRDLLTQDQEDFELMLAEMASGGNKIAARSANVFMRADSKVQSGILSTLDSELAFLDSERLARCTQTSDFHFRELKEKLTDVFLIIPPERLSTYAPFIRLFMGMAMLEMKRTKTKPQFPVLFMLDEFPALGRMKVIEEEITYLAGYDVRLWMFAQDLQQLASIYGDKVQSIIANCKVKQFFKVSDIETAKLVSAMCGNTTAPVISVSESSSVNVETKGTSMSGSARPLYDPNEVMNLPENVQLIFFQGQQPIYSVKVPYYQADGLFKHDGRPVYADNPYHS
jgi:type IV secretion system protein VirD4